MYPNSLPVGIIKTGLNYRRRFTEAAMVSLTEDIKKNGIAQPVLVRVLEDNSYELVAGGRRVIAFTRAFGPDAEIPVLVKTMTDAEATAAMVSENKEREDTTAIEDSEAAARMLGICKGDKAEAARRLNWTPNMLDRRLALMNACDAVRDAFIDEKIELGHVEILATMRREVQNRVIGQLLAAPKMPTVLEVKAMAERALMSLDAAIFNKDACTGCQFNTGLQQAMFETSFEGVRCTNRECYETKTEDELKVRQAALKDTFQVVRIVRPGDQSTLVPLRAEGPKGVGEEQAKACRTCGDFGACVSASPDKLGMTFKDICFNAACNAEKIAARELAEKKAAQASKAQETPKPNEPGGAASGAQTGKSVVKTTPKTTTASSEPRNAVKEYREDRWRAVFSRAALRLPVQQSRALLIALCLFRPRTLDGRAASGSIGKALGLDGFSVTNAGELMTALLQLDQKGLSEALQQIPSFVSKELEIDAVTQLMTALGVQIEHFWMVNDTFLNLLTKTEIDAVCVEIGVHTVLGKEYAKLKNGAKGDFIKAILAAEGFDFKGKVPALMRW